MHTNRFRNTRSSGIGRPRGRNGGEFVKNRGGYGRGRFFHTLGSREHNGHRGEDNKVLEERGVWRIHNTGSRVREYKDARVRRVNTSSSESTFNGSSCMERTSREQPRADTTMEFLDK